MGILLALGLLLQDEHELLQLVMRQRNVLLFVLGKLESLRYLILILLVALAPFFEFLEFLAQHLCLLSQLRLLHLQSVDLVLVVLDPSFQLHDFFVQLLLLSDGLLVHLW